MQQQQNNTKGNEPMEQNKSKKKESVLATAGLRKFDKVLVFLCLPYLFTLQGSIMLGKEVAGQIFVLLMAQLFITASSYAEKTIRMNENTIQFLKWKFKAPNFKLNQIAWGVFGFFVGYCVFGMIFGIIVVAGMYIVKRKQLITTVISTNFITYIMGINWVLNFLVAKSVNLSFGNKFIFLYSPVAFTDHMFRFVLVSAVVIVVAIKYVKSNQKTSSVQKEETVKPVQHIEEIKENQEDSKKESPTTKSPLFQGEPTLSGAFYNEEAYKKQMEKDLNDSTSKKRQQIKKNLDI